jgi:hypothetical protein
MGITLRIAAVNPINKLFLNPKPTTLIPMVTRRRHPGELKANSYKIP